VRQAVAAAIDTEGIAQAIGKGIYEPTNQLVCKGLYGYNPDYKGIPYNTQRAKELLAEAGYPNGFHTKLTYETFQGDTAAALQADLKAAGIDVEMVPLTQAAWFPQLFGIGWEGLMLGFGGTGNDKYCISSFNSWMGPNRSLPFILRDWPPEVLELLDKGLHTYDDEARKAIALKLMTAADDQMNVIPLYGSPIVEMHQPWLHSNHPNEGGLGNWHSYQIWVDKH
jgi:ABC-type transport system substrate-binding protein